MDTLKELFEGNERLFKDLAIYPHWDWRVSYPVLRFSFGGGNYRHEGQLDQILHEQLDVLEKHYAVQTIYQFNRHVYLFEFKVLKNSKTGEAMQQLHDMRYADKYRHLNESIYLIGVEFGKASRNVVSVVVETV